MHPKSGSSYDNHLNGGSTPAHHLEVCIRSKLNFFLGRRSNNLSIHLDRNNLLNTQQLEIAVCGPDGATHLLLCTGLANLTPVRQGNYTFLVGPHLSRRQFVSVIATGAISTIQAHIQSSGRQDDAGTLHAGLLSIEASYDEEACRVKVTAEVLIGSTTVEMAICYTVSILAELQNY